MSFYSHRDLKTKLSEKYGNVFADNERERPIVFFRKIFLPPVKDNIDGKKLKRTYAIRIEPILSYSGVQSSKMIRTECYKRFEQGEDMDLAIHLLDTQGGESKEKESQILSFMIELGRFSKPYSMRFFEYLIVIRVREKGFGISFFDTDNTEQLL